MTSSHAERRDRLFADAEVAEDHVQDVLDVDPAGQAAERLAGEPQLLGQQIFAAGQVALARAAEPPGVLARRGGGARG